MGSPFSGGIIGSSKLQPLFELVSQRILLSNSFDLAEKMLKRREGEKKLKVREAERDFRTAAIP